MSKTAAHAAAAIPRPAGRRSRPRGACLRWSCSHALVSFFFCSGQLPPQGGTLRLICSKQNQKLVQAWGLQKKCVEKVHRYSAHICLQARPAAGCKQAQSIGAHRGQGSPPAPACRCQRAGELHGTRCRARQARHGFACAHASALQAPSPPESWLQGSQPAPPSGIAPHSPKLRSCFSQASQAVRGSGGTFFGLLVGGTAPMPATARARLRLTGSSSCTHLLALVARQARRATAGSCAQLPCSSFRHVVGLGQWQGKQSRYSNHANACFLCVLLCQQSGGVSCAHRLIVLTAPIMGRSRKRNAPSIHSPCGRCK